MPELQNSRSHVATEYFRPRSVEDTVDAGVHPLVAKMRLGSIGTKAGQGLVVSGIDFKAQPWNKSVSDKTDGYTYSRKNGLITSVGTTNIPETNPLAQLGRLTDLGANTSDYFKQAKQMNLNPMENVLKVTKSGPDLPSKGESSKKKKKKDKKSKKDKKKKGKKKTSSKKVKKKDKKKRNKSSSSSSSSSDSSSSS